MEPLVNMEASSQHLTMDLPAEKPSYLGNPTLSMIDDAKSNDSHGSVDDSCGPSDSKENKESLGVKVKRKGRRGRSSGSLTMKGDKITSFTTERGVTYSPNDHVYIENNKPGQPYFICAIQDFSVIKRDTLVVKVKWYYRVSEVPDNVYQHLIQDRYHQDVEGDHPLVNPAVKSRELFCSEATDTYPVTALRGKCKVVHCNSLEAARCYQPAADNFYCILGYNPETKRLATTQGQIRVGSMYQARMPECKPHVPPKEMPERCEDREVFHWQPKSVLDGDLMMYLRAARSVAAFAGMCDGGSTEDGCQAASMDSTTMNAMHMLHRFDYDTGKALQALVKAPALRTIDKKWNEDDTKHFVKGLRVYGKNFFKIRKELLPHRETGELVEYYYFWKKSPAAAANRPHRRHRKHGVKRATTRSQRPASSEFLDLSSASDSDNDSEDSDSLSGFRCQNCLVTVSKDWSNAGKPSPRLCSKCRIFFKKYGVDRPLENTGDSPYFQPVKDGDINGTHNMLTRQNRSSTDSKDKKKGSNSVSSPDNLDSPLSDSKKSLVPSSPSAVSTCSNSSTDREKKRRSSVSPGQDKKRLHPASDSEDKFSKRKRSGPSESESVSDSSISGAEETPNDADIETNQDELTSSSPPTTPSPVESDYKQDKSTPVPIPVESAIGLDKLSELPRPEPQHPSPNRQPLESSPLLSPNPPQLPSVSQLPSQGFVALPPLPAFAFRPQCPLSDSIYPRPPFSSQSEQKLSADDKSSTPSATAFQPPKPHTVASEDKSDSSVISSPQVKEEVISPPQSPMNHIFIKQEPSDSVSFMSKPSQNGTSGKSANINTDAFAQKEPFELLTPKLEPGLPKSESGLHRPDVGLHRSDVGLHRLDSALHRIESGLHRPESGMHRPESGLHRPDTGLHRPDQNSHRQEQVLNRQEQSLHRPESGMQRDAGLPRPDSGLRRTDPGLHRQDPSLHRSEQGLHRVEGLYRPEPGVLRPEPGVHRSELGVHRPEQGVLRPEPGVLRPEPGVLRPEPGLHRPEPGVHRPEQGLQSSISNSNISANINSSSSDFTHLSSNQIQIEPTALTSQAEVKGQSEAQGVDSEGQEGERSEVEIMDDSDSERGTLTPGPVPTPCNKEILRSKSAIFIKLLNRGEHNSCSRCDLMFKPLPDSKLARRREDREKKVMTPVTPMKEEAKRKTESPPPNSTADAQVVSNIPPSHHTHQDRVTPRSSYHDTPALRQLSEYAKPHSMGQDPRAMAGYLGFSPFMDPIRMAAMYPPNSRERLELELERDKRERDQRERELREHELRSIEMREKLKAELEMKPPGLDRLIPPGANQLDPHWLEIQRRYGPQMLPGGSGSSHIPGIYPPTSLASDLMARERDRLERLGIPPGHPMLADSSYTAAIMERLSAERMSVERMSAERLSAERIQAERMAMQQDPMIRLQMSGMSGAAAAAAAAAAHAHTHTHAHSHTHLHLHQPDMPGGPLGPAGPVPTSSGLHHPLLPPHLLHSLPPGADPMSGVNGANNQTPPGSMPSLPVGLPPPHMLASREQELIQNDLYRRAYTDPALAQQLQAHHEALQRMVMERERFGSGHLPPPH